MVAILIFPMHSLICTTQVLFIDSPPRPTTTLCDLSVWEGNLARQGFEIFFAVFHYDNHSNMSPTLYLSHKLPAPPQRPPIWPQSVWTQSSTCRKQSGSCLGVLTSVTRSGPLKRPWQRRLRPTTLCLLSTFLCPTKRWAPGFSLCSWSCSLILPSRCITR